ncbi:MAG: dTMP kinase [Verrucomicrobia bacterium]|nr:MAG: dTMP kinase [Verrucomicrobiota bacterium]
MKGLFITFEGTEGSGKSTQVALLVERLRGLGRTVRVLREPGGTPIGEEIRHTLKHSHASDAMTSEAELLLMNASRAQLVRELIRPALLKGEIVVCDRFFDSTTAYQGYGRMLDLTAVARVIEFAVGPTVPDLTLLVTVTPEVSEERLRSRQVNLPFVRDRIEEADRAFFDRVARGYEKIAAAEPERVRKVDGTRGVREVQADIWSHVEKLLSDSTR